MKINITGALAKGKITKKELAAKLWPGSKCQYQNMRNLESTPIKTYSRKLTDMICEICNVDLNFLYGSEEICYSKREIDAAYNQGWRDCEDREQLDG